jgi:ParB-like chromosome segregation protein Spo0J
MTLSLFGISLIDKFKALMPELTALPEDERIEVINQVRLALHQASPFSNEPVDCVLWVRADTVDANEYNPNKVAPPEMRLLEHSVAEDGYTQPVVTWMDGERREVVDGFHRRRVGLESKAVRRRVRGYLPVTTVNQDRTDKGDRMAATIRHNRARGKHQVQGMSEIVVELSRRNWSDRRIAKELGMDPDEVLRLKQISGLTEMFADAEFSEAWEVDNDRL